MKKILAVGFLLFLCAAGWEIGGRLSTDAIGLALGVLFGVMAGIPAAMIALMASRRNEYQPHPQAQSRYDQQQALMQRGFGAQQPPVIILAGAPMQQMAGQQPMHYQREAPSYNVIDGTAYPVAQSNVQQAPRQFKLIGEKEEVIEDWM